MREVWKDLKGYEGYYQVSSMGRVRTLDRVIRKSDGTTQKRRGKISKLGSDKNNYNTINLWKDGKATFSRVCRLVAQTFLENPENKPTVNHKNGVRNDDRVSNLEWMTYSENSQHSFDTGLQENLKGEEHHFAKLSEEDVVFIRESYKCKKYNQMELSKMFNVGQVQISRIIHHKRWKHVK